MQDGMCEERETQISDGLMPTNDVVFFLFYVYMVGGVAKEWKKNKWTVSTPPPRKRMNEESSGVDVGCTAYWVGCACTKRVEGYVLLLAVFNNVKKQAIKTSQLL